MLVAETWNDIPRLVHGFLSRTPPPEPGTTTDWAAVVASHGLPPVRVVVARQVHGARIATIVEPPDTLPEADGLLTGAAGVAVGVVTADCVPVLLLDERGGVGTAVHAGWRGTLAGVVAGAVVSTTAQTGTPASGLRAAIGPAVGPCCYEVGTEVRDAFIARHGKTLVAPAFTNSRPRPHLDLRLLVRMHLETAGLGASAIETLGPCTVCDTTYASYRRDGARAGRQLSFIGWK